MSKFILPTQKGLELFPNAIVAPPIIRWVGVDARSAEAQAVLDQYGSTLTSFHAQQSQNHALSNNTQSRAFRQFAPNLGVSYVNQGGIEYVTLHVKPAEQAKPQESQLPEAPVAESLDGTAAAAAASKEKCLMVLYEGNKVAAIPMKQLTAGNFKPVYTKALSGSSWTAEFSSPYSAPRCLQHPPNSKSTHSGVWLGPFAFTDRVMTFLSGAMWLLEPTAPDKGVQVGANYYGAPVMAVQDDTIHTGVLSYEYSEGAFTSITTLQSSSSHPTAITNTGTRYYYRYTGAVVGIIYDYDQRSTVLSESGFGSDMYSQPPKPVDRYYFSYTESARANLNESYVDTSSSIVGPTYDTFNFYYTNPPYESHDVTYTIPVPSYSTDTKETAVAWFTYRIFSELKSTLSGTTGWGAPIYTKSFSWTGEGLGYSSGGSYYSDATPDSDFGYSRVRPLSFPPALNGLIFSNAFSRDFSSIIATTPYEQVTGGELFPRFHIANVDHVLDGYRIYGSSGSVDTVRIFLDSVDVTDAFLGELNTTYQKIAAMMMDVPLTVIKKFK